MNPIWSRTESEAGAPRYTHLRACISEDDGDYKVEVSLYDALKHNSAFGEETADSFEGASALIAAVAAEFFITEDCIEIEFRMDNLADGTRH